MTFRWICIYENPETSEVSEEFKTLSEALAYPARPKAQIIRNGYVLADERDGAWAPTKDGEAVLLAEAVS